MNERRKRKLCLEKKDYKYKILKNRKKKKSNNAFRQTLCNLML